MTELEPWAHGGADHTPDTTRTRQDVLALTEITVCRVNLRQKRHVYLRRKDAFTCVTKTRKLAQKRKNTADQRTALAPADRRCRPLTGQLTTSHASGKGRFDALICTRPRVLPSCLKILQTLQRNTRALRTH
jgi:hypothetical protein